MSSRHTEQIALLDDLSGLEQFTLRQIELFNWGTFEGRVCFPLSPKGHLLVGASGSGKSTILDAHSALLTPPKFIKFNLAARAEDRKGRDREFMTYVRGAWGQKETESGIVSQYLRPETTFSVIAETYENDLGQIVVLAAVFWVRGRSTASEDLKRQYLVLERRFSVTQMQRFAERDFDVRALKAMLPEAFIRDEFSGYQERFRAKLGIDSERALRLLHKTQSAKNVGELDAFMREFMLDAPETFEIAQALCAQFQQLSEAHQEIVKARRQIETLSPLRDLAARYKAIDDRKGETRALQGQLDGYHATRRWQLLRDARDTKTVRRDGLKSQLASLREAADQQAQMLLQMQQQRAGAGGHLIEQFARELREAEVQRTRRTERAGQLETVVRALHWVYPASAVEFEALRLAAQQALEGIGEKRAGRNACKGALLRDRARVEEDWKQTLAEIRALEANPSNIPRGLMEAREQVAQASGVPAERLPFAGELIEVKAGEGDWAGAIERALRPLATSMLVNQQDYEAVSQAVDDVRLTGQRLVYLRMVPRAEARPTLSPRSLLAKLDFAKHPAARWIEREIARRFNYECVDSMQAFRTLAQAITRAGQIKHSEVRHEKDDRFDINDRRHWVLGLDNRPKLAAYKRDAQVLADQWAGMEGQLGQIEDEEKKESVVRDNATRLLDIAWDDVDVAASAERVAVLGKRLGRERAARPDLDELDRQITQQSDRVREAIKRVADTEAAIAQLDTELGQLVPRIAECIEQIPRPAPDPDLTGKLDARYQNVQLTTTSDPFEALESKRNVVARHLGTELNEAERAQGDLRESITALLTTFRNTWPAAAGGLDASQASVPDFIAKLAALEADDLPRFEARFAQLLREQSDRHLTQLQAKLDVERQAVNDRLGIVNESLAGAPFGEGTHLVIEARPRALAEVSQFRAQLRQALSYSFGDESLGSAEERFKALQGLIRRLDSQEAADVRWRALVLDVRQHIEFVAREVDDSGRDVEVYQGGGGKSGGQRQKLAATVLAAALRYQLGGSDRSLPRYACVVLDEAFSNADADFTAIAMNIFRTFGFQILAATPMKSVQTLEPFIGGATFIYIRDRRLSNVLSIEYDSDAERLVVDESMRAQAEKDEQNPDGDGDGDGDGVADADADADDSEPLAA